MGTCCASRPAAWSECAGSHKCSEPFQQAHGSYKGAASLKLRLKLGLTCFPTARGHSTTSWYMTRKKSSDSAWHAQLRPGAAMS
jgi:hypothetical protein